jgi:hypothetical protein
LISGYADPPAPEEAGFRSISSSQIYDEMPVGNCISKTDWLPGDANGYQDGGAAARSLGRQLPFVASALPRGLRSGVLK